MEEEEGTFYTAKELEDLVLEGENSDREIFSEQRVNVLARNGQTIKKQEKALGKMEGGPKKLRQDAIILTQRNHLYRILKEIENLISEHLPLAMAAPFNESELKDRTIVTVYNWMDDASKSTFDLTKDFEMNNQKMKFYGMTSKNI